MYIVVCDICEFDEFDVIVKLVEYGVGVVIVL